jgi:translation elongation factor EF-1beta
MRRRKKILEEYAIIPDNRDYEWERLEKEIKEYLKSVRDEENKSIEGGNKRDE